MTPQEARQLLVDTALTVLPAEYTGYAGPPEVTSVPCVVAVPRDPYRRPGTFCAEILSVGVTLLEARSTGTAGVDLLDSLSAAVRDALESLEGVAYESTSLGPMIAPGGAEAYGATLNLELYL